MRDAWREDARAYYAMQERIDQWKEDEMKNPGATGRWYWTDRNSNGPAREQVELVRPDGTLAGVTLCTLQNAWGKYLEDDRLEMEEKILKLLNDS